MQSTGKAWLVSLSGSRPGGELRTPPFGVGKAGRDYGNADREENSTTAIGAEEKVKRGRDPIWCWPTRTDYAAYSFPVTNWVLGITEPKHYPSRSTQRPSPGCMTSAIKNGRSHDRRRSSHQALVNSDTRLFHASRVPALRDRRVRR